MIASLPMYWRAETADLWRGFWAELQAPARTEGLELPALTPPEDIPAPWTDHWLRPDLVLSMTCGLPFRTVLKGKVTYVGTLSFGLQAPNGHYFSTVLLREPPPDTGLRPEAMRLAYNSADSQSGWAVTQSAPPFEQPPHFAELRETGSHAASLEALLEGKADIAYLDAVTWQTLCRHHPRAAQVHVLGRSVVTPGLPLITAKGTDPAPLRRALTAACARFKPVDPMAMGGPLSLHVLDPQAYFDVPVPHPPADVIPG